MKEAKKNTPPMKSKEKIHPFPCLQCTPCEGGCTIVDNRISFIFDEAKKCVSGLIFDNTPIACLGKCGKSCQTELRLVQTLKVRMPPIKQITNNTYHMSITNIVNNENVTLVQGVNGLFLCEESWTTSRRKNFTEEKETQTTLQGLNDHVDARHSGGAPDLTDAR